MRAACVVSPMLCQVLIKKSSTMFPALHVELCGWGVVPAGQGWRQRRGSPAVELWAPGQNPNSILTTGVTQKPLFLKKLRYN